MYVCADVQTCKLLWKNILHQHTASAAITNLHTYVSNCDDKRFEKKRKTYSHTQHIDRL